MSDNMVTQRVACKAVIELAGKVLVLREGSTYEEGTQIERWGFPGGRINPGEPFLDGLRREILEETGIKIVGQEPLYIGEWFPTIKGQPNHIVAIFFICKPAPGTNEDDIHLSEEHDAYRWVTEAEAKSLDVMPPDDDVLATYYKKNAK